MSWREDLPLVVTMAAASAAGVLVAWMLGFRVVRRLLRRRPAVVELIDKVRTPARVLVAVVAFGTVAVSAGATGGWRHLFTIAVILAVTWTGVAATGALEAVVLRRVDVNRPDNLRARGVRTQIQVIERVVSVGIVVVGVAAVLMTFPDLRTAGASVLASAGLAGIVAGIAGRSTLGNLIAGVQIAFAAPIRLDDVVVVEGEWGRVEEITLTYVVVALWDWRRLVLPTTHFVDQPFQNWTRRTADLLGAVHLHVDYGVPVDDLRAELQRTVAEDPRWDGNVCVLQVVDAHEMSIEVRALVSAANAPDAWDLRCNVRERLVTWLAEHHPEALPRLRATAGAAGHEPADGITPPGP